MGRDWQRLANAVRDARTALKMTQIELADAADVSEATVQNLESGAARTRLPFSLPKVERALGWAPDSGKAVLAGGDPTPLPSVDQPEEATPAENPSPGDLPLRIIQELADGPLLDTTVMDLTPLGSEARMIVVVKGKPDASPEQIRKDLLAWQKAQRKLQNLGDDPDRPDDDRPIATGA